MEHLRPLPVHPPPRHHFVKHEERAVLRREGAEALQVPGLRQHHAHVAGDRFHDHRRDGIASRAKELLRGLEIVIAEDDGVGGGGAGDAGRIG